MEIKVYFDDQNTIDIINIPCQVFENIEIYQRQFFKWLFDKTHLSAPFTDRLGDFQLKAQHGVA
ncbi:MAG: hypothetical protein LBV08_10790 [Clostridiales bacterium]|jgi:hypothetical protein|nr:hypothetical protein [Clostridiales bacterium]